MNLSRNRFFFSYVRPLGQVRLSERREAEARPDKLSRGFVCASNKLLPLSLEFRGSTAYPCACLRSLCQKREKSWLRINSHQSFWLFSAWIRWRTISRDSFYVQRWLIPKDVVSQWLWTSTESRIWNCSNQVWHTSSNWLSTWYNNEGTQYHKAENLKKTWKTGRKLPVFLIHRICI